MPSGGILTRVRWRSGCWGDGVRGAGRVGVDREGEGLYRGPGAFGVQALVEGLQRVGRREVNGMGRAVVGGELVGGRATGLLFLM
jgi:hypothetical protein